MSLNEVEAVEVLDTFPVVFKNYKQMVAELGLVFKRDKAIRESQFAKLSACVVITRNGRQITFSERRVVKRVVLDFRAGSVWQHLSSIQLLRTIWMLGRHQGTVAEVTLPRWELPEYLGLCNCDFSVFAGNQGGDPTDLTLGAVKVFLAQAQAQSRTVIEGAVAGLVRSGAVVHYHSWRTETQVLGIKESVAVSGINARVCRSLGLKKVCARAYVPAAKRRLFDARTRAFRERLGIYGAIVPCESFIFDVEAVELALADSVATVLELNVKACEKLTNYALLQESSEEFLRQWMQLVARFIKLHEE